MVARQARVLELDVVFAVTQLTYLPQYISNQHPKNPKETQLEKQGDIPDTELRGVSLTPRRAVMWHCSV